MLKERVKHAGKNISKYIRYFCGSYGVEFEPGTQAERKKSIKRLCSVLFIIIAIVIIVIVAVPWIRYYNRILASNIADDSWLGFIGSFWGAVIGAGIASLGTIVTTWMVIRRSYRIDFHRERMEHLPVLEIVERKDIMSELQSSPEKTLFLISKAIWYNQWDDTLKNKTIFEISNVGAGMAVHVERESALREAGIPLPEFIHISKDKSAFFRFL